MARRIAPAVLMAMLLGGGLGNAAASDVVVFTGELTPEVRAMLTADDPHFETTSRPDATGKLSLYPHAEVDGHVRVELDWRYSPQATSEIEVRADEVWARWARGIGALTMGRQVFRWGQIDEFGVVDVLNPQRLLDFGADQAQRKIGVWAAAADVAVGPVRMQAIVMPWFTPSRFGAASPFVVAGLPRPQTRMLETLAAQAAAAAATMPPTDGMPPPMAAGAGMPAAPQIDRPPASLENVQVAGRVVFSLPFAELSLLGARLYDQIGTARVQVGANGLPGVRVVYPRVVAVGGDVVIPFGDWSLASETLYLYTDDHNGRDPFTRNPTLQSAGEIRWQFHPDWQVRAGIQDEQVFRDAPGPEHADERSLPSPLGSPLLLLDPHLAHVALLYTFGAQFSQISAAYAVAYETNGHFVSAELDYGIVDGIRVLLGGQMFTGRRGQSFGRIDSLDNIYTGLKLIF